MASGQQHRRFFYIQGKERLSLNRKMERDKAFRAISEYYNETDLDTELRKGSVLKETSKGLFVPTNMRLAYEFFNRIRLEEYSRFIDLGSGDGRIVLIASLFTQAEGIEYDDGLYQCAQENKKKLGFNAEFSKGDMLEHDISGYDSVFMYPDKEISPQLNEKLKRELKGDLFVFTSTFLPEGLETEEVNVDFMKFCICRNTKNI
ncbi:hypothetical protein GF345_02685 [Candidatus Woesearchaeota archaeon]|nr:hypothetical protein [Candidatus Woesearchaeota archaeon]